MKKTLRLRITALVLCMAAVLLLSGCGEELTGKWRSTSEKETQLVFSASGKVILSDESIELNGTYTADGKNIVMSLTAPNGEVYMIEAIYTLTDDELLLENSKGQVERFVR